MARREAREPVGPLLDPPSLKASRSLVSMLEEVGNHERISLRVILVESNKEVEIQFPSASWEEMKVKEFASLVAEKAQEKIRNKVLFLSYLRKEELMDEGALLSSYDVKNRQYFMLWKLKPQKIRLYFHKDFYIDPNVTAEDALRLLQFTLARHDWSSDDQTLGSKVAISDDTTPKGRTLQPEEMMIPNESQTDELTVPEFVLEDHKENILLACAPTSTSDFSEVYSARCSKRKSLSFINRNLEDEVSPSTSPVTRVLNETLPQTSVEASLLPLADKETILIEPVDNIFDMANKEKKKKNSHAAGSFLNTMSDLGFLKGGKTSQKHSIDAMQMKDSMNVPIHLVQSLSSVDDGIRIFSLPLELVMQRESETGGSPKVILALASYLEQSGAFEQEGIFRKCGNQSRILDLITTIDRGEVANLEEYDIHEVSSVFKLYFQLLPKPIFTYELYPRFMAAVCLEDKELRNTYYNALLATVPEIRRKVSKFLFGLLQKVAERKDYNKMGAKNLGIVFGPLFLQSQKQETNVYKSYLHYSKYIINCTKHMVSSYNELYKNVPSILLVRSKTSRFAKKPGELDLTEGSLLCIISKDGDSCFSESGGRFGTLPSHFFYNEAGEFIFAPASPVLLPAAPLPSAPSPKIGKLKVKKRRVKHQSMRKPKAGEASVFNFETTFRIPQDIFSLLPKWKQDELVREAGLLDPVSGDEAAKSPQPIGKAGNRTTIPVRLK